MSIYQGSNKVSGLVINTAMPVGAMVICPTDNVPSGWWICDGRAVSRTTYKELFAVIGTTWGDGDGSTTFNIPDTRNQFVQGSNDTNVTGTKLDAGLPNITGEIYGSTYANTGNIGDDGVATGAFVINKNRTGLKNVQSASVSVSYSTMIDASKGETKLDGTLQNDVYGNSDTVQPPSVCMNYIIKYSDTITKQVELIDDTTVAEDKAWSSNKVNTALTDYAKESELSNYPKFPDYANAITVSGTSWTATEDCYIIYNTLGTGYKLSINGVEVSTYSYSNPNSSITFNGYIKKGDVISATVLNENVLKVFPLR